MVVSAAAPAQVQLAADPPLTPEDQQAVADAEAAFAQAVGSVTISMAMNSMSVLTEALAEIGNDE